MGGGGIWGVVGEIRAGQFLLREAVRATLSTSAILFKILDIKHCDVFICLCHFNNHHIPLIGSGIIPLHLKLFLLVED